jgi:hypothetical protein
MPRLRFNVQANGPKVTIDVREAGPGPEGGVKFPFVQTSPSDPVPAPERGRRLP